jgi:hypothetical protein
MKTIKTNVTINNFKGEPLKNGEEILTTGIVISAVLGGRVSNPTLGWQLGKKFATDTEVELKAEDVVFIKKELEDNAKNGGFAAIVIGQVIDLLESKEVTEK